MQGRRHMNGAVFATVRRGVAVLWVCLTAAVAFGQGSTHPLQPPDRSSPRAALKTFLDAGDAFGTFLTQEYLPSPSRAGFHHVAALGGNLVLGLDLSHVPPASRPKVGKAAAFFLYETLSRITLPPLAEIPGADASGGAIGTNDVRWAVPQTEIVFVRVQSGPRSGEFLFSPETVAKAGQFYRRVCGLDYVRPLPYRNLVDTLVRGGGWMVPYAWVQALPSWLRNPLAGQAAWKWIALTLTLVVFLVLLVMAFRLSRLGGSQHPFRRAVARVAFPGFFLLATPTVAYLSLVQINLRDGVGGAVELVATAILYLAGAWMAWRVALVVAEAIIASPRIARDSIDAHLIRICSRLLGIVAGAVFLAMGADRLGTPLYGIVAGLGVGGLAIALAAQPTIENLIGGLSLFADKPVRVGDLCRHGTEDGTVESIGLRSTRIRGVDRTLITIPNAEFARMAIVNLAERDRMLIRAVLGVRYETSPDQLRHLLGKIRELLAEHPRIHAESARVRFIGFGPCSLDIEVFAYVTTRDRAEFLSIQEDVWLRVMDIVSHSGTAFAFPSQTLYFGRDRGLDTQRTATAEAHVCQRPEAGRETRADGATQP